MNNNYDVLRRQNGAEIDNKEIESKKPNLSLNRYDS